MFECVHIVEFTLDILNLNGLLRFSIVQLLLFCVTHKTITISYVKLIVISIVIFSLNIFLLLM